MQEAHAAAHAAADEEVVERALAAVPVEGIVVRSAELLAPSPHRGAARARAGASRFAAARRAGLNRRLLALFDAVAVTITLLVCVGLPDGVPDVLALVGALGVTVLAFNVARLYERDELLLNRSTLDELPQLFQLTALLALTALVVDPLLIGGGLTRGGILAIWLLGFVLIVLFRCAGRAVADKLGPLERCLVLGDHAHTTRVAERLGESRARARVVAGLPLHTAASAVPEDVVRLERIVDELDVDRIIVAPSAADTTGIADVIRVAKAVHVRVSVLPRMMEAIGSSVEVDDVGGMNMLGVRRFGLTTSSRMLKRAFDMAGAAAALVATAPFMALIALAIRLDSPGPVFFRQTRVGRDGRRFTMLKFRSMEADAESRKEALRELNVAGPGLFKLTSDPRVTRMGAFLRATSLDELPQLFNVLRGDMSLVGPRPLVVDEDALVFGLYRSRLHLTPGMTGPWQVGTRVPMDEMVGMDYVYVANWSLWRDIKILLRTVAHVLRRRNV